MKRPQLRQFGDLYLEDFERHPVWIRCHTVDYNEPWYEDADEETFRPWTGEMPAATPSMLLVRATIELRDGSRYPGFVTPYVEQQDTPPNGRPNRERGHVLGRQQPQIFVGDRRFGFWGGIVGIPAETQQEFCAALGKTPDAVFPLRFSADPGLAMGLLTGEVDGFYRMTPEGIQVERPEPIGKGAPSDPTVAATTFFEMSAVVAQAYPQPEDTYKSLVYSDVCAHCGIHGRQDSPFRFKKSGRSTPSGFLQLNWVADAFFVRPDIAAEITTAGITGVSFGPTLDHRTSTELGDRVQLLIPTVISCAETSRLPTVTCRPNNEEAVAIREMLAKWPRRSGASALPPDLQESLRKRRERLAAIPFCGRVKHHGPTSLVINLGALGDAPDLFQTAEWFGSGHCACRLTLASERFVTLVRQRGWRGLEFHKAQQSGWSERV